MLDKKEENWAYIKIIGDCMDKIKGLINDINHLYWEMYIYSFPYEDIKEIQKEFENEFITISCLPRLRTGPLRNTPPWRSTDPSEKVWVYNPQNLP